MSLSCTGTSKLPDVIQTSKVQLSATATDVLTVKSASGTSIMTIDTQTPAITLAANTTIVGNAIFQNSTNISVADNLIQLASSNTASDLLDQGYFGTYNSGSGVRYWALYRPAGTDNMTFYDNVTNVPGNTINTSAATLMSLIANNLTGTLLTA